MSGTRSWAKMYALILAGTWVVLVVVNKIDELTTPKQEKVNSVKIVPQACDQTTQITGKKYSIVGSGSDLRKGPGSSYERIVNQKATSILKKTQYIGVHDDETVIEECTKDGWSWVRVIDPEWLKDTDQGWVESKNLDKGQDLGADKYARKISVSAIMPYTEKGYPTTVKKYGKRLSEIERYRRRAAEMAADSGKCDQVRISELSEKSTLNHLYFWVECKNMTRIYLDEFEIDKGAKVLTQKDKSWDKESAMLACEQEIKARALIPGEVDIHDMMGTSFQKTPPSYHAVLYMDFDARNAFGAEVPYTAICNFHPGEVGTIEIRRR